LFDVKFSLILQRIKGKYQPYVFSRKNDFFISIFDAKKLNVKGFFLLERERFSLKKTYAAFGVIYE
jgi:drug/metabolite transporter superfamily protein YnfA